MSQNDIFDDLKNVSINNGVDLHRFFESDFPFIAVDRVPQLIHIAYPGKPDKPIFWVI